MIGNSTVTQEPIAHERLSRTAISASTFPTPTPAASTSTIATIRHKKQTHTHARAQLTGGRYLALLAKQTPIESCFIKALPDHLNAEVSSGTVTTVEEGVTWLSYTYLHVRMRRNPMMYGVPLSDREADPMLLERRRQLITQAAETLDDHKVC